MVDIRAKVRAAGIRSQAMILVGSVLEATDFADSRLYVPDFSHRFRKAKRQRGERVQRGGSWVQSRP